MHLGPVKSCVPPVSPVDDRWNPLPVVVLEERPVGSPPQINLSIKTIFAHFEHLNRDLIRGVFIWLSGFQLIHVSLRQSWIFGHFKFNFDSLSSLL